MRNLYFLDLSLENNLIVSKRLAAIKWVEPAELYKCETVEIVTLCSNLPHQTELIFLSLK